MTLLSSPIPRSRLLHDESRGVSFDAPTVQQEERPSFSVVRGSYCGEVSYGSFKYRISPPLRELVGRTSYTLHGLERFAVGKGTTWQEAQRDFAKRFHRRVSPILAREHSPWFVRRLSRWSKGLASFYKRKLLETMKSTVEPIDVDDLLFDYHCVATRVLATFTGRCTGIDGRVAYLTLYDESGEESEAEVDAEKVRSHNINRDENFKMTIKSKGRRLWLDFDKLPEPQIAEEDWDRIEKRSSQLAVKQGLSPEQMKDLLS
jgi:hypothetical protein